MLKPDIYWVPQVKSGRLAMMPRPRAEEWLADEISGWEQAGLQTVVSLLESHEARALRLDDEANLCARHNIEFLSYPIPDRGTPKSMGDIGTLVEQIVTRLGGNQSVGIHCRAGIGRTGLLAACVLLKLGVPYASVFSVLSDARRLPVPDTDGQKQWVERYAQVIRTGR